MANTEVIKIELKDLNNLVINENIDLFLGFISFEKRSVSIALNLDLSKVSSNFFFMNRPSPIDIDLKEKNQKLLMERLGTLAPVLLDKNDPFSNLSIIYNTIRKYILKNNCKILIDITTFNHETLLLLMRVLSIINKESPMAVKLIYNPAKDYAPTIADYKEKWLSKGVKEIRTVLGFPGNFSPLNAFHLLILVGMEYERVSKLVEKFEPSQLSLGFPMESNSAAKESYQANIEKYQEIFSTFVKDKVHFFNFSAYSPLKTKVIISEHLLKFKEYNNVIAPMNNKLSTIGVGLLCLENQSLQICYPIPSIYNLDYSTPSDNIYIFKLF